MPTVELVWSNSAADDPQGKLMDSNRDRDAQTNRAERRVFQNPDFDRWEHYRHLGYFPNTFSHPDASKFVIENIKRGGELPFPAPVVMQYGESKEKHRFSGKRDFDFLVELLRSNELDIDQFDRILDFGCSNGRVMRHFEPWTEKAEVWGCDVNSNAATWCLENLSPPFRVFVSTTTPHLPIEDRTFSFIYCYSIFTHIDDLFVSWFLELRRVMQPGGHLFVTIHDQVRAEQIKKNETDFLHNYYQTDRDLFDRFLEGKVNFFSINRDVRSMVFMRREFFRSVVGQLFDIVDEVEGAMGGCQAGFLLRKP